MRCVRIILLLLSAFVGMETLRAAESNTPPTNPLADSIAEQAIPWVPVQTAQLEAARAQVAQAADRLERFLAGGSEANAEAWKRFLGWESIDQLIAEPPTDAKAVATAAAPLFSGQPGLELPPFVELRDALAVYYNRLLAVQDAPEMAQRFADRLADLRQAIQNAQEDRVESRADIAVLLEWFEQLEQAPELIQRIRDAYAHPNLQVTIASDTIAKRFNSPVSDTSPVQETILGTPVRGVAHTVGNVTARLLPSEHDAQIELIMTGTATSDTRGYRPPVTIYSDGVTQVFATKRLWIGDVGIWTEPASASCSTSTQIRGIRTANRIGSQLVRKIAWKQIYAQKPQAEQISARLAERRAASKLDQQVLDVVGSANGQLATKIRQPLVGRNLFPRLLRFRTTADRLHLTALQARTTQLGSSTAVPDPPSQGVTVQVHESLFQNTASSAIGGMVITDVRAKELVEEFTGEVPEQLQIKPDEDPWSITFDRAQPLTLRFDDDHVTIALRGRQFTRGDQPLRQVIQIAATYQIAAVNGRVRLTRQGEINVTFPGKDTERLSLTELRNKTFMTNKFEGLFRQEISGEGLQLPERWQRLGELALEYVSAQNGWLSLGWN